MTVLVDDPNREQIIIYTKMQCVQLSPNEAIEGVRACAHVA